MRGWLQGVVLFLFVPTTGGLLITQARTKADSSATDKAAIRKIISDGTEAWNRGDAKAYSQHFQENGGFTNMLGMVFCGRKGFEERHAEIFGTILKGSTLQQTIRKIRFVRPDVAVVDVDTEWTPK